jgi:hypothetical protein
MVVVCEFIKKGQQMLMEYQKLGSIYSIVLCTVLWLVIVEDKREILALNYGLHTQLISFVDWLNYGYFQGKPGVL